MASNGYEGTFHSSHSTKEFYSMDKSKIGFSLILNMEHVKGHSPREGSRIDVNAIKSTLREIGFDESDIYEENDPTEDRIDEVLQNCNKKDYKEMNCSIGFILSHGYNEHIKSADNKSINLKRIFNAFKTNPSLLGKPKIFIIQACRGSDIDLGSTVDLSWCSDEECDSTSYERHSTEADVLVAYSSSEGFKSSRNRKDGSVFIQMLCLALREYHPHTSFIEILTKCLDAVVHDCVEKYRNLQVPSVSNTLRKKLLLRLNRTESRAGSDEMVPVVVEKPYFRNQYFDKIELLWNFKGQLYMNDVFQIVFREAANGIWKTYDKSTSDNMITITGLKAKSKYHFKIKVINHRTGFEGTFSEINTITTEESRALAMRKTSKLSQEINTHPPVYDLPIRPIPGAENKNAKTRKFELGNKSSKGETKTIMLVGSTGSGKSTLINAMTNYILGVSWEDDFRFNIVHLEDSEKQERQPQSQTEWITCYQIRNTECSRIDYSVNLIDTPGFGDTRGVDQDAKIVAQIRELFTAKGEKGVDILDAVCFVVKAPDSRLTVTQKNIFELIRSMFGNDVKGNICTLVTFADGQKPPVLDEIEAIPDVPLPYKIYFTFNNSAIYADNTENLSVNLSSFFWNMGIESFDRFFAHLKTLPLKSLQLTSEVLFIREKIENTVANIQREIDSGMHKISTIEKEIRIFTDNKEEIEANKNFTYQFEEIKKKVIRLEGQSQYTTNCLVCNFTCHENCKIPNDENKANCCAMKDGKCTECPGACNWQEHRNTPYIIKLIKVVVTKRYADMEKKYQQANKKMLTQEQSVEKMQKEVQDLDEQIQVLLEIINKLNNRLKKIALRQNPLSTIQYIDLLIAAEKKELKTGFESRIHALDRCKDRIQYNKTVEIYQTRFKNTTSAMLASQKADEAVKERKSVMNKLWDFFKK